MKDKFYLSFLKLFRNHEVQEWEYKEVPLIIDHDDDWFDIEPEEERQLRKEWLNEPSDFKMSRSHEQYLENFDWWNTAYKTHQIATPKGGYWRPRPLTEEEKWLETIANPPKYVKGLDITLSPEAKKILKARVKDISLGSRRITFSNQSSTLRDNAKVIKIGEPA